MPARARSRPGRRPRAARRRRNPSDPFGGRRKPTGTILDAIGAGDRVRIRDRFGKEREGRAVMLGPYGWVLNMGGAHGTPAIATPENIVRVKPAAARRRNPVQYEGDDRPTPRKRRARAGRPRLDAATRKHLAAWLKSERPRGQRAARAAIMRALEHDPELIAAGRGWSEIERLGEAIPNPGAWSGHASVRGGELFSRRVVRLEYEHVEDPAGRTRFHDFAAGVFMYALKDGTVLLRHREHPRKRVWADLPTRGRR